RSRRRATARTMLAPTHVSTTGDRCADRPERASRAAGARTRVHPMPTSAEIRERLPHPVIDVDGHYIELVPVLAEHIREVADARVAERLCRVIDLDTARAGGGAGLDDAARPRRWGARMPWWGAPRSARDRVTAHVPAVLRSRLDELGIDVSILYPSLGL